MNFSNPTLRYALLFVAVVGVATASSYFTARSLRAASIVYVDMAAVFDGFAMTRTLKQELETGQRKMTRALDSMAAVYKQVSAQNPSSATAENLKLRIKQVQERYAEEDQEQTQQFNKQIWTQLNQYMKEYAADRGYDLILGKKPVEDDVVMVATPALDKTQEAIAFINARYAPVK